MIPLGEGYNLERLASALGEPRRAGLLPPVPYGWAGSGLRVAGAHVPLVDLRDRFDQVAAYYAEIGNRDLVIPFLPQELRDSDWRARPARGISPSGSAPSKARSRC